MANKPSYLQSTPQFTNKSTGKGGYNLEEALQLKFKDQGVDACGALNGLRFATTEAGDPAYSEVLTMTLETISGTTSLVFRDKCGAIRLIIGGTLTSASPSASPSASLSVSASPSVSPSVSRSVSPSSSSSASLSPSSSVSLSVSPSASTSPSATLSPSASVSPSSSSSLSPSPSSSQSPSASVSRSPSASPSPSA